MEAVDATWARRALPGFFSPLEVVASVPTTMSRAADLAAAGEPEGATVVAEEQTEGRGRLGRAWVAPPGTSLLVSVVLRPPMATDAADSLHPRHVRDRRRTEVRRTGGTEQVQRYDGRGGDPDDALSLGGDGVGVFGV